MTCYYTWKGEPKEEYVNIGRQSVESVKKYTECDKTVLVGDFIDIGADEYIKADTSNLPNYYASSKMLAYELMEEGDFYLDVDVVLIKPCLIRPNMTLQWYPVKKNPHGRLYGIEGILSDYNCDFDCNAGLICFEKKYLNQYLELLKVLYSYCETYGDFLKAEQHIISHVLCNQKNELYFKNYKHDYVSLKNNRQAELYGT
jgi:hypothetical protein